MQRHLLRLPVVFLLTLALVGRADANPISIGHLNETFTAVTAVLLLLEVGLSYVLLRAMKPQPFAFLSWFLLMNVLTFPLAQSSYSYAIAYIPRGEIYAYVSVEVWVVLVEAVLGYVLLRTRVPCESEEGVPFRRVLWVSFLANVSSASLGLAVIFGAKAMEIETMLQW